MPSIVIKLNGDAAWPDLKDSEKIVHLGNNAPAIELAVLEGGMASGLPSCALRIDLPDGRVVIAETSARIFCGAARTIMAKYPDLFADQPAGPIN